MDDGLNLENEPSQALWTLDDVAARLATTNRHVRRLVADRRLPHLRIGRFLRFEPSEVERWIAKQRPLDVEQSGQQGSADRLPPDDPRRL